MAFHKRPLCRPRHLMYESTAYQREKKEEVVDSFSHSQSLPYLSIFYGKYRCTIILRPLLLGIWRLLRMGQQNRFWLSMVVYCTCHLPCYSYQEHQRRLKLHFQIHKGPVCLVIANAGAFTMQLVFVSMAFMALWSSVDTRSINGSSLPCGVSEYKGLISLRKLDNIDPIKASTEESK